MCRYLLTRNYNFFIMNTQRVIFVTVLFNFVTIPTPVISQHETSNQTEPEILITDLNTTDTVANQTETNQTINHVIIKINAKSKPTVVSKLYKSMMSPLKTLFSTPKINSVMRNIATCVVNGAVEIISYYFPAPLIPIIASAASMMVPFEPILMLRDKLPVTSYRRAFMTALNSFLGVFDKYKLNDVQQQYDPYMMQRFNRRMMNFGSKERGMSTPLETSSPPMVSQKGNKGDVIYTLNRLFKTLDRLSQRDHSEDPRRGKLTE